MGGEYSMRLSFTVSAGVLLFCSSGTCADTGAAVAILHEKCLSCHGESSAMSGLVLTTRENLLKGGSRGPAIVPGKAAESLLYKAVSGSGELLRMPPMPPVGGGLPAADIAILKEWLDAGAPWSKATPVTTSQRWAFRKPERLAVPSGAPHPIDAFLNRKLQTAAIIPSREADRLTLLRRASYDLLGLPPTKEQIDAFLGDRSPNAWERVVYSLLA